MLSVHEAREKLLLGFRQVEVETVPLEAASGRVLAEEIRANRSLPPFSNSSMDGFALRAADVVRASEDDGIKLQVIADIPAGTISSVMVKGGEAARIMTGAPLPQGATAVIPVELTDFNNRDAGAPPPEYVTVYGAVKDGDYIRKRGEDLEKGQLLLSPGRALAPRDIGMIAMLGLAEVKVTRKPKIALLSNGDELMILGSDPVPGRIFESNSYVLAALAEESGSEVLRLGIAPDQASEVEKRLDAAAAAGVDMIISSAGVSVGAYDYVREVLEKNGELGFWRVNMRPGKPLAFGRYRGVPFIGLPGNPVSSYVGFRVFVIPAILRMLGAEGLGRTVVRGKLKDSIESDGRESYLRVVAKQTPEGYEAELTGHQGSGNHHSLVIANAFAIIPSGVRNLSAGDEVEIWLL